MCCPLCRNPFPQRIENHSIQEMHRNPRQSPCDRVSAFFKRTMSCLCPCLDDDASSDYIPPSDSSVSSDAINSRVITSMTHSNQSFGSARTFFTKQTTVHNVDDRMSNSSHSDNENCSINKNNSIEHSIIHYDDDAIQCESEETDDYPTCDTDEEIIESELQPNDELEEQEEPQLMPVVIGPIKYMPQPEEVVDFELRDRPEALQS
jgi:hypothetical protein